MCTSPNIPERRKTPPLRGRLVKWEYTNAVSKITLSVCLADDGIVRVTYFTGPVPEDEPSYAVSPGYSAPGAEVREYDEAGVHVIETSLLRIRIRTEEQKVDFYDIVTDEPLRWGGAFADASSFRSNAANARCVPGELQEAAAGTGAFCDSLLTRICRSARAFM